MVSTARDVYVILNIYPYKRLVKQFLNIADDGQSPPAPLISNFEYFKAKTYRNSVPGGSLVIGPPQGSASTKFYPPNTIPNTVTDLSAGGSPENLYVLDDNLAAVPPLPTPAKGSLIRFFCDGNDDVAVIGYCCMAEYFVMISDVDPAEGEGT